MVTAGAPPPNPAELLESHAMSEALATLREQLGRLEAPVLGIVANAIKVSRGGKYGYGNYGSYYAEPAEQGAGAELGAGGDERA